ncbi:excinuclease ABC subunit A [Pseudomonas putida S11]|nr:excinuclease ABC subunit A [Pseudomonas putida S11]
MTAAEIAPAPCRIRPAITPPDGVGLGRQYTAQGKDDQPQVNHRPAADAIGNDPERDLQYGLGQAIGTNGQADQRRRGTGQVHAVGGQHRQDHEHAQHTKGKDQGQAASGAGFAATHALVVGVVHGLTSCEPAAILSVRQLDGIYATLCRVLAARRILPCLCPPSEAAVDKILIRGARTHNLKNIDLTLPRDKLIVITGLSGSGKSSLAFDTLYAEGQRRYVESLSAYARQFLSMMEKPDVDTIEGLSPAISIEQKSTSHNPRSTVGTITEIYDYLRLLYARVGTPRCPDHDIPLEAQTISQMVDLVLERPEGSKLMLLAPGGARAQGRAPGGVRRAARPGLRARPGKRQALRTRRTAQAGQAEKTQHRCGGGPFQGPRRPATAPGRVVRDRAQAGRRHSPGSADG